VLQDKINEYMLESMHLSGEFTHALANLYIVADEEQKEILATVFHDIFKRHENTEF